MVNSYLKVIDFISVSLKEYFKSLKGKSFCAGLWHFFRKLWRICKTCNRQFVKVWHIYFYKLSIACTIVHAIKIFHIYAFFIMLTLLVPHFIRINFIGRIQIYSIFNVYNMTALKILRFFKNCECPSLCKRVWPFIVKIMKTL